MLTDLVRGIRAAISYPGKPPSDPSLAAWFGVTDSAAGVQITEWTALNLSAVWAAVSVLSSGEAMMPLELREGDADESKPATSHPVYDLTMHEPCPDCDPFPWRESRQAHALTWGNGYSYIERDGRGRPKALWPLAPNRVRPDRDERGVFYAVMDPETGLTEPVPDEDMLHLYGLGYDGVLGYSVIQTARESLGLTGATERFGSTWFGNGSWPSGFLTTPAKLQPKQRRELVEGFERRHQGPNWANKIGLLDGGLDWKQTGVPPEDSQFLGTRQFQTVEVARWFNVPPHMIRDLSRSTNNNIEQQSIEYVVYSLGPWGGRWEQQCKRKLLRRDEWDRFFFEHDPSPLLRGDALGRWGVYQIARQNGVMNADEIRRKERMNPIGGTEGGAYFINSAMVPVKQAVEPKPPPPAFPPQHLPPPPGQQPAPPGQPPAKPPPKKGAGPLAYSPDQDRDDHGRFGEGQDPEEKATEDRRYEEDNKIDAARADEDKATEDARYQEDEAIDSARYDEDKAAEAAREKEDGQIDAARAAEDKKDDRRQDREARQLDRAQDREKDKLETVRGKEDGAMYDRHSAENDDLEEKQGKERGEMDDRQGKEREAATEEQLPGVERRHEAEEAQLTGRHDGEKADLDRKHDAEEKGLADARGKEDAALDVKHEGQKEELGQRHERENDAKDVAREKEDDARRGAREKEDDQSAGRRQQEDDARQDRRDAEDEASQAKRDAEDEARQQARDQEDAERERRQSGGKARGGRSLLVVAQRGVVQEAAGRLARKLGAAARKAANKPAAFLPWLDEFMPGAEKEWAERLTGLARVHLAMLGRPGAAEAEALALARAHVGAAREGLLDVAGASTAARLAAAVAEWCERWERERPGLLADELMREEIDHA